MPYTAKQNKLFRAAQHDPKIAKAHGMSQAEAKRMAAEGVKKAVVKTAAKGAAKGAAKSVVKAAVKVSAKRGK